MTDQRNQLLGVVNLSDLEQAQAQQRMSGEVHDIYSRKVRTVFPDAEAKFFLTANPEERARRRARELTLAGRSVDPAQVLEEMRVRDERDSRRAVAPLRKAEDAVEIDSAGLTPDEVVDRMASVVRARGG